MKKKIEGYALITVFSIVVLVWVWFGFKWALTLFVLNMLGGVVVGLKKMKKDKTL